MRYYVFALFAVFFVCGSFALSAFAQSGTSPSASTTTTAPSRAVPPSLQKLYDQRKADISAMDTNGDGVLSPDELAAATQSKFDAADTNQDGVISPEEQAAAVGAFKTTQQKTYGAQTANKAVQLQNRFDAADANKDGLVSKEEYEAYYTQRYKKFDKNADGTLDLKEYQTDVESRRKRRRSE